jgi:hypothetical protein
MRAVHVLLDILLLGKQRVADGHVSVKSHQSQDRDLDMDQGNKKVTLN